MISLAVRFLTMGALLLAAAPASADQPMLRSLKTDDSFSQKVMKLQDVDQYTKEVKTPRMDILTESTEESENELSIESTKISNEEQDEESENEPSINNSIKASTGESTKISNEDDEQDTWTLASEPDESDDERSINSTATSDEDEDEDIWSDAEEGEYDASFEKSDGETDRKNALSLAIDFVLQQLEVVPDRTATQVAMMKKLTDYQKIVAETPKENEVEMIEGFMSTVFEGFGPMPQPIIHLQAAMKKMMSSAAPKKKLELSKENEQALNDLMDQEQRVIDDLLSGNGKAASILFEEQKVLVEKMNTLMGIDGSDISSALDELAEFTRISEAGTKAVTKAVTKAGTEAGTEDEAAKP